jgi:hypothetical protein
MASERCSFGAFSSLLGVAICAGSAWAQPAATAASSAVEATSDEIQPAQAAAAETSTGAAESAPAPAEPSPSWRAEIDKLNLRIDAQEESGRNALGMVASQAQLASATATNHIYFVTCFALFVTIVVTVVIALQAVSIIRWTHELEDARRESETRLQSTIDRFEKGSRNTLDQIERQKEEIAQLHRQVTDELSATKALRSEVELVKTVYDERFKSLERTNADQEAKLRDLEGGRELMKAMRALQRSHQPPNKIKRDILALLLRYDKWSMPFSAFLADTLQRWNIDEQDQSPDVSGSALDTPSTSMDPTEANE